MEEVASSMDSGRPRCSNRIPKLRFGGEIWISDGSFRQMFPAGAGSIYPTTYAAFPWFPPPFSDGCSRDTYYNQERTKPSKKKLAEGNDFGPHSTEWSYGGLKIDLVDTSIFSKKVFIGGLPPDVTDKEILATFQKYGSMKICWPKKDSETQQEKTSKGYCFLSFDKESSVGNLVESAQQQDDSYYVFLSRPQDHKFNGKKVHIRPWRLEDSEYFSDETSVVDEKRTVYVYGVPRPITAKKLAAEMAEKFGNVVFAGLDLDSREKYPLCQARVSFQTEEGYFHAIHAGSIQLQKKGYKPSQILPYTNRCLLKEHALCEECLRSAYLEPIREVNA